jgi:hypothetical protein
LLDKQQFIDYYNSEIVQLLTSNKSSPVCSDDSKNNSCCCIMIMLGGVTPHDSNEFMAEAIASTGDFWKHPEEDNTAPTRLVVPDKL